MINISNIVMVSPEQMKFIIEGMRNPLNSWDKSDSEYYAETVNKYGNTEKSDFLLGCEDHKLMCKLSAAGTDHRKFMRMMPVYVRITAPLYWWKEFDTYKVGTVANSCSTMHKITSKEFTLDDFSIEHMSNGAIKTINETIDIMNDFRESYLKYDAMSSEDKKHFDFGIVSKKDIWWQLIQLLPSSYNQTRNVMMNYETLANIYEARKKHKLDEWRDFCKFIEKLPYSELICGLPTSTEESNVEESPRWNLNEPIKCMRCNGTGHVRVSPHVFGISECPVCNGTGKFAKTKGEE